MVGTDDALLCIDFQRDGNQSLILSAKKIYNKQVGFILTEVSRIGEAKKIHYVEYIHAEHLLVVISGKQKHVRLIPIRALDGDDVEWLKVADTKNCLTLTAGLLRSNNSPLSPPLFCLCVAVKRQVS